MRICVTGGAGFLGRSVMEFGKTAGHEMHAVDRNTARSTWAADVSDWADITGVLDEIRPDHVIHLAGVLGTSELFDGSNANRAVEVNVGGSLNVIQWCTEQQAGYTAITMPESGWANVYAATKRCAVELAEAYRRHKGLRVSNVCAYNAYGPAQKHGDGHPQKIIPTFASRAWAGLPIEIWGDGEQTVDLVHTDDIARMLIAATAFGGGETFDAGTGIPLTVNEVAAFVLHVVAEEKGTSATPAARDAVEYLPMRAGEDAHTEIVARGRGWDLLSPDLYPVHDWDLLRDTILSYRPQD